MNADVQQLAIKGSQAVLYIVGSALAAYNLFAFTVTKRTGTIYFKDDNQLWLAIGVAMVATALVIKNWKKL